MLNSIDLIYIQLATIITSFYYRLDLSIRVCFSSSYEFLLYELLCLTIEVYLPSQIDYVYIRSILLIDDYFTRRFMIKYSLDNKNYVVIVHAHIADVS
ncbi:unnamed protein product [Rotaria sp. Silwood2]|nr:unnamed protein product [Rotaria sp. Silwood2]CAF3100739.1 unnamed protein product [Rotaria sp. Silwood2]CAF3129091.1 unnamed protein product [Rotaria sp. Silwood2]CAF3936377.1 unnamed protein product [Rotaria sp. Silwood2]CAF4097951.1 unnamed protein product [Rotaria sp. Silwood2]